MTCCTRQIYAHSFFCFSPFPSSSLFPAHTHLDLSHIFNSFKWETDTQAYAVMCQVTATRSHSSPILNGAAFILSETRFSDTLKTSTTNMSLSRSWNSTQRLHRLCGMKTRDSVRNLILFSFALCKKLQNKKTPWPNWNWTSVWKKNVHWPFFSTILGEVELEKNNGEKLTDWCNVLINGSGPLNEWKCRCPNPCFRFLSGLSTLFFCV